jgi:hypothetical protein
MLDLELCGCSGLVIERESKGRSAIELRWKRNGAAKGGVDIHASSHQGRGRRIWKSVKSGVPLRFPVPTTVL